MCINTVFAIQYAHSHTFAHRANLAHTVWSWARDGHGVQRRSACISSPKYHLRSGKWTHASQHCVCVCVGGGTPPKGIPASLQCAHPFFMTALCLYLCVPACYRFIHLSSYQSACTSLSFILSSHCAHLLFMIALVFSLCVYLTIYQFISQHIYLYSNLSIYLSTSISTWASFLPSHSFFSLGASFLMAHLCIYLCLCTCLFY